MRPTDEEVRRTAAGIAGNMADFALPFIHALVKLRKAADSDQGCTLEAGETKAVVAAFKLLKDPR